MTKSSDDLNNLVIGLFWFGLLTPVFLMFLLVDLGTHALHAITAKTE